MGIGSGYCVESSGERIALDLVKQKYKSPYCIFDVGSNQGQYLDLVLRYLPKNNFIVHCFEPGSYTFKILESQLGQFDKNIIRLSNVALRKEQGKLKLFYNEPGSVFASLTKRRLDHIGIAFNDSEYVMVDTVDNYCQNNDIEQIHLLKIDVEGHELDVLAGSTNMFTKGAIGIVVFEFGECNIDTRIFFKDLYNFFKDINMSIFRITPKGFLYPIDSYKERLEQFTTINYLAIRKD